MSPSKSSLRVQTEAEFLINQSSQTCLTVLQGKSPDDAIIGMAPFTGGTNQQWHLQRRQWHWGGNRSYCLAIDTNSGGVCLVHRRLSVTPWTLSKTGILTCKNLALDVPWENPREKVIMYPQHCGSNQKWWTLSHLRKCMTATGKLTSASASSSWSSSVLDIYKHEIYKTLSLEKSFFQTAQLVPVHKAKTPDYLISQSTYTCVTVVSGTCPEDAVIGLADYTGCRRQQWFVVRNRWHWGGNQSYCLAPNWETKTLCLTDAQTSFETWTLDEGGLFSIGKDVLHVPYEKPRMKLVLHPKNCGINQRWWTLSTLRASLAQNIYPVPADDITTYKQEVYRGIENKIASLSEPIPHIRDVRSFPGSVPMDTPRIFRVVTLDLRKLGQRCDLRMTVPEDWQATDMYVAAGDLFKVNLPKKLSPERTSQITLRVGAQCDCLDPKSPNVVRQKKFKRMPTVTEVFELNPGVNMLRSQYGGNLIFMFQKGENFVTNIEVHNAIESPYYKQGITAEKSWERMKTLQSPYSILEGEKIVLVVPTSSAIKISSVEILLQHYNTVITKLNDLAGFDEKDDCPPQGKYWLVDDVQITAGSAHAGFPVMFDNQYYDLTLLTTPYDWVTWHELGHNYQQGPWWSYIYGSESTVNLFSLYIQEILMNEDRLTNENHYLTTANAVDRGLTFEKANCWQKLVFLMEIKHAFPQQAWDIFRQLNKTTRALPEDEANTLASSPQLQYDYVYKVLSEAVGYDLIPHYNRWGINISLMAQMDVEMLDLDMAPADLTGR